MKLAPNERYLNSAQPWLGTFLVDNHGFAICRRHTHSHPCPYCRIEMQGERVRELEREVRG